MKKGHQQCKDHAHIVLGACYCPRTRAVYVNPWYTSGGTMERQSFAPFVLRSFTAIAEAFMLADPTSHPEAFILLSSDIVMDGFDRPDFGGNVYTPKKEGCAICNGLQSAPTEKPPTPSAATVTPSKSPSTKSRKDTRRGSGKVT